MAGESIFYGVGDLWVKTLVAPSLPAQNIIIPLDLFEFELTADSSSIEGKAQKKGVKKIIGSAIGEVDYNLKLSGQLARWDQIGFFLGQLSKTASSISLPVLKSATVPSSSPYEITDAAITTGTAAGVYVYLLDGEASTYIKTGGSAASGVAQVDGSGGKLVFHSSAAGKSVVYTVPVAETNQAYYGGDNDNTLGNFELWGTVYGPEHKIWVKNLTIKTKPSLSFTGSDVATLEIEATANVTGSDIEPYVLFKAPGS